VADGLIVATALEHDLTVATRNVRDFADLGVAVFDIAGALECAEQVGRQLTDGWFPLRTADGRGGGRGPIATGDFSPRDVSPRAASRGVHSFGIGEDEEPSEFRRVKWTSHSYEKR
jgi:hypothetical protein